MSSGRPGVENANPLPRAKIRLLARHVVAGVAGERHTPADDAWVCSVLTPGELELWRKLSAHDQRHSVEVAKTVQRRLAATEHGDDARWLGAALMHDIGKLSSDLSLGERVIATLASKAVGVAMARQWASSAGGAKRRIGLYLVHGEVGARLIRAAGGREEVAAWSEVHQGYGDVSSVGIPPLVVEALLESDAD